MSETAFDGEEVSTETEDFSISEKTADAKRGFSDPEVLAKAQATRAANRGANKGPVDFPLSETAKKRGRPPGAASAKRDLTGITMLLVGIHEMLASATGLRDLTIDHDEAGVLASALARIGDQYKIKIDGKTGAFLGLIYAMVAVYGPRAMLIGDEVRKRKNHVAAS